MIDAELITSKEYHLVNIQLDLFQAVEAYLARNEMSRTDFAKKLGVSKGYVSQLLNGDFDSRLSKLVELALAVELVPEIKLEPITDYVNRRLPELPNSEWVEFAAFAQWQKQPSRESDTIQSSGSDSYALAA
jgi:transcriptional regulator with XRE-family HTH domain